MRWIFSAKCVVAFVLLQGIWAADAVHAAATTRTEPCSGDCDGDGEVTVDELVVAVNIALGAAPVDACPAVDADGNRRVSVNELLKAISASIEGCATPTPTSTQVPQSATPTPSISPTADSTPADTLTPTITVAAPPSLTPTQTASPTPSTTPSMAPTASSTPTVTEGELIVVSSCSGSDLVDAVDAANQMERAVIRLEAGCTYDLHGANNDDPTFGHNALPVIRTDVGIDGRGSTVQGDGFARIFQVATGATLRLNDVTVSGGYAYGNTVEALSGGCIYNQGTTILTHAVLTGNRTAEGPSNWRGGDGGAILNASGTVTATDSIITNNATGGCRPSCFEFSSGPYGGGGYGGGIYNSGSVTLVRCSVEGNFAGGGHRSGHDGGRGGGIVNFRTLTVIDSTFRGNRAGDGGQGGLHMSGAPGADGGAIYNRGNLIVVGSTFSGNAAGNGGIGSPGPTGDPTRGGNGGNGGAIANVSNLTVVNSTMSGNSSGAAGQTYTTPVSDGAGGGIYNNGTGALSNVTIAHNTARNGAGGGVATSSGGLHVGDSILAANTAGNSPDCSAVAGEELNSEGYNLVGRGDGCNWTAAAGDQIGTLGSPIDAALGPLRDNGGPTFTHALSAASPAVDGGDPAGCEDASGTVLANDQRGNPREQDGDADGEAVCDIGAFELEGASD